MQVVAAAWARLAGLHAIDETSTGAASAIDAARELVPSVAVTVALWLDGITAAAETLNVAVVDPAGTATEAGVVSKTSLLASDTVEPPAGLGFARVRLQVEFPETLSVAGLQLREDIGGTPPPPVTMPPVLVICIPVPDAEAATGPPSPIEVVFRPEAIVKFTNATVPFAIVFVFKPEIKQETLPAPGLQTSVLPEEVDAKAGTTAIAATLLVGYVTVHCRAAGEPAVPEVHVTPRDTLPLTAAIPEERDKEPVWPDRDGTSTSSAIARIDEMRAALMQRIAGNGAYIELNC